MKVTAELVLAVGLMFCAGCATTSQTTRSPETTTSPQTMATAHAELPFDASLARQFLYGAPPIRSGYPNAWTILVNRGYESAYDETFRNPAWVAYELFGSAGTSADRPSGYPTDTRTSSRVTSTDYPSGYDHGHVAPNEAIARFFGDEAQAETFLMSNMLPQRPGLNRGPWKSEETLEYSKWEPRLHHLWIIAGPIYTASEGEAIAPTDRYGAKQVCIPVACFKIVVAQDSSGKLIAVAFIMPQEPGPGHKPKEFLRSIREIEHRTGLNFFSSLPQAQQDELETRVADDVWP